jgi:hypothetical protein
LKKWAIRSCEMTRTAHPVMQCHIAVQWNSQLHCCKNLQVPWTVSLINIHLLYPEVFLHFSRMWHSYDVYWPNSTIYRVPYFSTPRTTTFMHPLIPSTHVRQPASYTACQS